ISPSGERSHGMSSALTTLGSASYILRNSCEAAMSSMRRVAVFLPTWAKSRSSRILLMLVSQVLRRAEILVAGRCFVGRVGHDLLEQEVHEQKQRLGLEYQKDRLVVRVVVEMLMHARAFDDHDIARLPLDAAAVMNIVAAALEHIEHGAVEMPVLLAIGAGCIAFDMGLDRLHHIGGLRAHHVFAIERRPALPWMVARRIDPGLLEQGLVDVAIGAGEFAHEGALFRPAFPLALLVFDRRAIVALSRRLLIKAGHPSLLRLSVK